MNGLKCYFTRDQVRKLIEVEIEKKLDPRQFLGKCSVDVELCDDGRVEVTFWKYEDSNDEGAQPENSHANSTASDSYEAPASSPRLVTEVEERQESVRENEVEASQSMSGMIR